MKDKSASIVVNGHGIASGFKCRYCGVIRPYDRPECFCKESKADVEFQPKRDRDE